MNGFSHAYSLMMRMPDSISLMSFTRLSCATILSLYTLCTFANKKPLTGPDSAITPTPTKVAQSTSAYRRYIPTATVVGAIHRSLMPNMKYCKRLASLAMRLTMVPWFSERVSEAHLRDMSMRRDLRKMVELSAEFICKPVRAMVMSWALFTKDPMMGRKKKDRA